MLVVFKTLILNYLSLILIPAVISYLYHEQCGCFVLSWKHIKRDITVGISYLTIMQKQDQPEVLNPESLKG